MDNMLSMLLIIATFVCIATSKPVDQSQAPAPSVEPSDGKSLPCADASCSSTTDTSVSVRKRRFIIKKIFKCVLFGKCHGHKHLRHLHEGPPPPIPPPVFPPPVFPPPVFPLQPLPPVFPPQPLPPVLPVPPLPPMLPPPVVPPPFPPPGGFLPR